MKFTLSWLKQHLETEASLDEIVEKLTALGLEVEGVEDRGAALKGFKIAHVVSAEKHPDADKLRCLKVDTGDEIVDVVCGAPNAQAGLKGVFARPGMYVPGIDVTLKPGVIRGQVSNGMMCSEREMCLSDEHDGIIELAEDAPIGVEFAEYAGLDDPIIEIGLTPDRGDCAGVRGIARDLAAAGLGRLKPLDAQPVIGGFASEISVLLDLEDQAACPYFIGRQIKNVQNKPSPKWLQDRLLAIGLRPISALVDITNYFSFDLARPLHVFDADKVSGNLSVRLSKSGEEINGLNDKSYKLDDEMCVVADEKGVAALGGILGGEETGCTEDTQNVFLELALFDPIRTAMTGRKLQINTDARYRFERGVDAAAMVDYAELATKMILELCGGEASELVVAGAAPTEERVLTLRTERVASLGGLSVSEEKQLEILQALGFDAKLDAGVITATVPSWRPDVEGEADLVEEVLRVVGLDEIPSVAMERDVTITQPAVTQSQYNSLKIKRDLAARGLSEAVTWSFMSSDLAKDFADVKDELKLVNPISSDLDMMRPSILPNLLEAVGRNDDRGFANAALFEVGPVFLDATDKGQKTVAAGVRSSFAQGRHWADAERKVDAFDAKADALAVIRGVGGPAENAQITPDAPSYYHPGRSAALRLGKNVMAYFGEIHPAILEKMGIRGPVVAFEVFLDAIPAGKKKGTGKSLLKLSPFQPVSRDFAFIMDEAVGVDKVLRAAKGADKKLISDVRIFDVYQGKGVEEGQKSVAFEVVLQPMEKTLTDEEIDAVSAKICANIEKTTGGSLRS